MFADFSCCNINTLSKFLGDFVSFGFIHLMNWELCKIMPNDYWMESDETIVKKNRRRGNFRWNFSQMVPPTCIVDPVTRVVNLIYFRTFLQNQNDMNCNELQIFNFPYIAVKFKWIQIKFCLTNDIAIIKEWNEGSMKFFFVVPLFFSDQYALNEKLLKFFIHVVYA